MMHDDEDGHDTESTSELSVTLLLKDRKKCAFIADIIILQCIVVCVGATSILGCSWTPDHSTADYAKLTRIMYLFDSEACGYKLRTAKEVANLHLSNETYGFDVLPIKFTPAIASVSSSLSAKTRKYIQLSFIFHVLWLMLAFIFRVITKNSSNMSLMKYTLVMFYYSCVFISCFDLSMAVVYVTDIKQSLSKGMILRYSGWGTELKLSSYEDFAGWLPIVASVCWLRGGLIFMLNLYFCRAIRLMKRTITKRELFKSHTEKYQPFPEAQQVQITDTNVLVYRVGEKAPQTKDYNYF